MASSTPERYRQIAEGAMQDFTREHSDLQILHSEVGVPEAGWVKVTPHPEWAWRRLRADGDRELLYRISLVINEADYRGIHLEHYVTDTAGFRMKAPNTGYVFWNGLVYNRENQSAIAEVVRRLEDIWRYSEDQLTALSEPSP